MKKPTLISALAVAVLATASLALPGTASASSFKHEEVKKVHGERYRDHDGRHIERHQDYRHPGHSRWAPSQYRHDRGHHYGNRHGHRYDYRPIERHRHHRDDDVRVRIFYDIFL